MAINGATSSSSVQPTYSSSTTGSSQPSASAAQPQPAMTGDTTSRSSGAPAQRTYDQTVLAQANALIQGSHALQANGITSSDPYADHSAQGALVNGLSNWAQADPNGERQGVNQILGSDLDQLNNHAGVNGGQNNTPQGIVTNPAASNLGNNAGSDAQLVQKGVQLEANNDQYSNPQQSAAEQQSVNGLNTPEGQHAITNTIAGGLRNNPQNTEQNIYGSVASALQQSQHQPTDAQVATQFM